MVSGESVARAAECRQIDRRTGQPGNPPLRQQQLERTSHLMSTTQTFLEQTAADLMSRNVISLSQHMPLAEAAHILAREQISGAPVVDSAGRCVGVLSVADLAHHHATAVPSDYTHAAIPGCVCSEWAVVDEEEESLPPESVGRCMTPDPVLVPPTTSVGELSRLMLDAHIHRVIVADAERRPLGLVSSTDLLAAMARAAQTPQ